MAQQMKTGLQRNQHCDVTEESRKSRNNPILLQQLLNNGISLQTLMHLFCEYEIVILFWNNVSDWILSRIRVNIVLDKQHTLFDFENKGSFFSLIDGILLLCGRFLVYRCKYSESKKDMLQVFNLI